MNVSLLGAFAVAFLVVFLVAAIIYDAAKRHEWMRRRPRKGEDDHEKGGA